MSPQEEGAIMRYSTRLRNAVLRKVLPPENQTISAVGAEFGISIQTIQRWMRSAQSSSIGHEDALVPPYWKPLVEKFEYVLEAAQLSKVDKGQ